MSEHTSDTIGQILWFAMFLTPLLTVPLVWRFFKVQKVFRVLIGLVLAGFISFLLYHLSLRLIFSESPGATLNTSFPKAVKTNQDTTFVEGNVTTTISTSIEQLGRFLDFKTYKPVRVRYKYVFIDNSGQHERIAVPGPSDYTLQALLYFDSLTFEKFRDHDRYADYPSPGYNKSEFMFDWLDKDILTELENSKPNYHGHPDFFFSSKGKAWYLHRKILISKWTN